MKNSTDSVRIIIFDKSNPDKFLLLSEIDDPENFKLPGGRFESAEETVDGAAKRELLEELGVNADQINLERAGDLVNDDGISARYIFKGVAEVEVLKPSTEIAKIMWVNKNTIPEGKNKGHILAALSLV